MQNTVYITLLFLALIIVYYVDKKLEQSNLYSIGERLTISIFLFLNIACNAASVIYH
jgi:hypothetical protein